MFFDEKQYVFYGYRYRIRHRAGRREEKTDMKKRILFALALILLFALGFMSSGMADDETVTLSESGQAWVWPVQERYTYVLMVPCTVTNNGSQAVSVQLMMKAVDAQGRKLLTVEHTVDLAPGQTKGWTSRTDVSAEQLQQLRDAAIGIVSVTPVTEQPVTWNIRASAGIEDLQAAPLQVRYRLSDPLRRQVNAASTFVTLMYRDAQGTLLYAHTIQPEQASSGVLEDVCQLDEELSALLTERGVWEVTAVACMTEGKATEPPVTTPVPTPSSRGGEWLKQSEFTLQDLGGRFGVDFSDYARTHEGDFCVFWEYDRNDYYTSDTTGGEAHYEDAAVPGETLSVVVYWMGEETQRPEADWSRASQIALGRTGAFALYGFREMEHSAAIYEGGEYHHVAAFSQDDAQDENTDKRIHYVWYHDQQTETKINGLAVLYAPDGSFYLDNCSVTFAKGNSGGDDFNYSFDYLFKKIDRLNGSIALGAYSFEMYLEGQLADRTEFEIARTRRDAGASGSGTADAEYITFGHYPQTESGGDSTPIQWQVLAVDGQKALLISRYALDAQPYNNLYSRVTWESCSLRTWLNDTFLTRAFSAEEQACILLTDVDNGPDQCLSDWGTNGGNSTKDKVFLLSFAEASRYLEVLGEAGSAGACASPTAYAIGNGAWVSGSSETADGDAAGRWWLRSPGENLYYAAEIETDGSLGCTYVHYKSVSVRPAIWVDLSSDLFKQ